MEPDEARRRREFDAVMDQIRTYQRRSGPGRFSLTVPVWRLALEGAFLYGLAFMSGLGLAVLYQVFAG
jgi:hypothetical protein